MIRKLIIAGALLCATGLAACADDYGPPPPGYAGAEPYRVHVRRCVRNFPNYRPRLDAIVGPDGGTRPCPL